MLHRLALFRRMACASGDLWLEQDTMQNKMLLLNTGCVVGTEGLARQNSLQLAHVLCSLIRSRWLVFFKFVLLKISIHTVVTWLLVFFAGFQTEDGKLQAPGTSYPRALRA